MTTTTATPRLRTDSGAGAYIVMLGDKTIGRVWRTETRYNIRPRALTVTSWHWRADGVEPDRTRYSTRRDAFAALTLVLQEQQ
jgi:hypothetical protein